MTTTGLIINNEELRIVMVGKTGIGKSATGNTILGRECFESKTSAKSMTVDCAKCTGTVEWQKVAVIDTPGLFDTRYEEDKTTKDVSQCISYAAPGPHVFLVVIRLGRYTQEEMKTVQRIQELFGQAADKYSMVLFTHGDRLEDTTIEDFLDESPDLQELVTRCNGQYHVFNNKRKDQYQVTELLQKIRDTVRKNGGNHYTNEMFQEAARALEAEKQRILKEKEEQKRKEREEQEKKVREKYEMEMNKINEQFQAERERERKEREEERKREREEREKERAREREEWKEREEKINEERRREREERERERARAREEESKEREEQKNEKIRREMEERERAREREREREEWKEKEEKKNKERRREREDREAERKKEKDDWERERLEREEKRKKEKEEWEMEMRRQETDFKLQMETLQKQQEDLARLEAERAAAAKRNHYSCKTS